MSWLAFTVDVEEWFHVLDTDSAPAPAAWNEQPVRVERNTRVLLDHLEAAGVRGTFFVLGWIGERYPELVREVARRGHEVACHGHEHLMAFRVGRNAFRADARRAKQTLEDVLGAEVAGDPGGRLLDHPADTLGLRRARRGGLPLRLAHLPGAPGAWRLSGGLAVPHRVERRGGGKLVEFPIPPLALGPLRVRPTAAAATCACSRRSWCGPARGARWRRASR